MNKKYEIFCFLLNNYGRDELNMRFVGIEIDSFDVMKCFEVEMF